MSETPKEWTVGTLGDFTIQEDERVGRRDPAVLSSTKHRGLVPSLDYFKNRQIFSKDLSNYKLVKRGWFAYATNHLSEGSIGLQDIFDEACVSPIYTVFSTSEQVDPRYLLRLVKTPTLINSYSLHEQASVDRRGAVRYRDFAKIPVSLPPIDEQQKIVEILDAVDESIRSTERLIAKLAKTKLAVLRDVLYMPADMRPQHWRVLSMGALVSKIVDGVHSTPEYRSSGVPFVTVENLTRSHALSLNPVRYISMSDHRAFSMRADPRPGDVLVSKDGTLGVARLVPKDAPEFSIFVSVALLRPKSDIATPELICSFFQSGEFEQQLARQSSGTGLQHIHLAQFREFLLAVPPVEEQRQVFDKAAQADASLATTRAELNKLLSIKRGLMEDLLTGRVRVKVD